MDLGIGFCGLSAYLPCNSRVACLPCPHYIATPAPLPLIEGQRRRFVELRLLGETTLPAERKDELTGAIAALDQHVDALGAATDAGAARPPSMGTGGHDLAPHIERGRGRPDA